MKQKTPEGIIKNQICNYLKTERIFFWIQQAGKIPGRINRSRFLINGISDILGIYRSRMLAIEVKVPGGRVSPEQQSFIDSVNDEGGLAFVAYSLNDVVDKLSIL